MPKKTAPLVENELVARLRLAVSRLARRLRQESDPEFTPSQLSTLAALDRDGAMTLGDLAAAEHIQPPSMTRIVGVLEARGYVERLPDSADRRVAWIKLTSRSTKALSRIREQRSAFLAKRLKGLDADEVDAIERALPALEKILENGDGQ